ncbi:hypothetical protein LXL04_032368 [Taraxacum kok-saghyz]
MQKLFGEEVLYHGMPKYHTPEESNLFLSLGPHVDVYFPPRKRSRVSAPFVLFSEQIFKKQQTTIDALPDECLFEIFTRVTGTQEKNACASVSKRWLMLLSTIHKKEIKQNKIEDLEINNSLTRCLKGKKATDIRLAAISVGTSGHGGLDELSIYGNNARVVEIANECHLLEKLQLSHCPRISDKSLIAIANNCPNLTSLSIESCSNIKNEGLQEIGKKCPNLKSILIKNCSQIGDQGVASLVSSASSSLMKVKLHGLNVTDTCLAVIGHYGMALTELTLVDLPVVTEKGFWVMGSGQGLQKLKSLLIMNCNGVTDVSLEALGRGCPNLKLISIKKSGLSDSGLVSFAKSSQSLESILLEECHVITQLGIFGFIVNSTIKNLSLTKCFGIKDLPMIIPSTISPSETLKSLTVSNCPGFGNSSLAVMGRICHQIQDIVLTGLPGITDSGVFSLVKSSESGVTKLDLSKCVNLTDKIVSEISMAHGGTLEVLNLDGCGLITDASVVTIAQNCSLLRELDVSKSAITDFAIAALACAEHLNLQILSVSGCQVSNKSVPFLKKLGETLIGLNMMQCRGVSNDAVGILEGQIWKCDILV